MEGGLKQSQLEKVHLASLSVKPTSEHCETSVSSRHYCFLAGLQGTRLPFPSALHTNLLLFQLFSVLLLKRQHSVSPICRYQQLWLPIYPHLSVLSLPRGASFPNQVVKPLSRPQVVIPPRSIWRGSQQNYTFLLTFIKLQTEDLSWQQQNT